jgi:hypothetical protein
MLGNLWEGYVIEDIINTMGDEYQYFFYRTADGAECDLAVFKGNTCIAAIDAKFTPQPKRTKSITTTMHDLQPQKVLYVIPECSEPYPIAENQFVCTAWQVADFIRS